MAANSFILEKSNRRIFGLALAVLALDQLTKWLILNSSIMEGDERVIIPGFFNLAYRVNTGAAWSMFTGNNAVLAIVALIALIQTRWWQQLGVAFVSSEMTAADADSQGIPRYALWTIYLSVAPAG